ncbi:type IV secretion system DNA-binding domain-containing protein [Candidatus Woesebacteria bacterium]|nr:MAG: type IV secretion system DNA-binding domain-containing protein [Candidatus Woesebacteria bacterium]
MSNLTTLLLKVPRNTEVTPEAAQTFLTALTQINPGSGGSLFGFLKSTTNTQPLALEIIHFAGQVHFQLTCDINLIPFIETQIHSSYPLTTIDKVNDPISHVDLTNYVVAYFKLKQGDYYPLTVYPSFKDVDPMSSILSVLSKAPADDFIMFQIALETVNSNWQANGQKYAEFGTKNEDGTYKPRPDASIIKEKISYPGFKTSLRILAPSEETLGDLINTFEIYTRADGNAFVVKIPKKGKLAEEIEYLKERRVADKHILNIQEIATLWHLPSSLIKTPTIAWGNSVLTEPPQNLPIATDKSPAEKSRINFFAKTRYQNKDTVFGIKDKDRLRHVWVVGKTGTGKSTMIANMGVDDLKKDRGIAVIDPHGDLCEDLLNYIPSSRINDTIYFNPADKEYPIILNPLEVTNREEAELVVAGLMSIFTKVWSNVWSARMEYILRNSFLTLTEIPNSTLADVLRILANQSYRNRVVSKLKDEALVHFWQDEFDAMPEKLQKEAIAPIQNKVGQFVTSPMIRRIIGTPKSSISIDDIMNQKKILLVNLSQGRLGEDNASLLGAMLITKFQLAAMHRVDTPKEDRVPFYLYVDEFQNFATDSFVKILSEARKYGLALLLANQYMAQIPDTVQKAILGNAGTMISFSVGADDARVFNKEFAEVFSENDMVNLANYQIAIKLMIDAHSTRPFLATTLSLPESINSNREKVIKVSRERWSRSAKEPSLAEVSENETYDVDSQEIIPSGMPLGSIPIQNATMGETLPILNPGQAVNNTAPEPSQFNDLANRIIPAPIAVPQQTSHAIPLVQGEKDILSEKSPEVKEGRPKHTKSHPNPNAQAASDVPQFPWLKENNKPFNKNPNTQKQQLYDSGQNVVQSPNSTLPKPQAKSYSNPKAGHHARPKQPQFRSENKAVKNTNNPNPQYYPPQEQNPLMEPQNYPNTNYPPTQYPNAPFYPTNQYPPQYPPVRPAFDQEAENKKIKEKMKNDADKLSILKAELAKIGK